MLVVTGMGGCWIVEVVVRPELLDIGGVGIVADVLLEERWFVMYISNP